MLISGLFAWSLTLLIGYLCVIVNGGITDDAFGTLICNFQGFAILMVTNVAISGHIYLGVERYNTIILNRGAPTLKTATTHSVGLVVFSASIVIVHMVLTEPTFEPLESGTLCLFRFTSNHPADVWLPISMAIGLSLAFGILWVVFLKIYKRVLSIERDLRDLEKLSELALSSTASYESTSHDRESLIVAEHQTETRAIQPSTTSKRPDPSSTYANGQTPPKTPTTDIHTNLQRQVLKRCVIVLLCFQAFYSPTFFTMVYRLITHKRVDPTLEACCALLAELDMPVTAIMFFYFDEDHGAAVRRHVWEPLVKAFRVMLRISRWKRVSVEDNNTDSGA
ncbi:hypothetical protein HK102_003458 [Quaeritorhiza haematococci]|nr:hypothetical protein HK102_003458 [Quaeritorhiza haematococci]